MYLTDYFLLLICAHIFVDIGLQPSWVARQKRGLNKAMIIHVTMSTLAFTVPALFWAKNVFYGSIFIWITHWAMDASRVEIHHKFKLNPTQKNWWTLLSIDQIWHVVMLFLAV